MWPILNRIFKLSLTFENSEKAIAERKAFLYERKIGICDIVASAQRERMDASDLGMQQIQLRNLIGYLENYPSVKTLLFTGGNSKNGPEYFFRKHLKEHGIKFQVLSSTVPRRHLFVHPITQRSITTVSLTAPSGAANRAVGSLDDYKKLKAENPDFNTLDYRVMQYGAFF